MDLTTLETNFNSIQSLLDNSISFLEKGYLSNKDFYEIAPIPKNILNDISYSSGIRLVHLTKFIYDEKENILDKLSNIFTALYGNNSSAILLLDSDGINCNFYLGVKDTEKITQAFETLKSTLQGNFPGVYFKDDISSEESERLMLELLDSEVQEVSTVTGIPSLKSEDKEKFLQGIERVINGMEGKQFSAIFIADPISYNEIKDIKKGFESLYNEINPYITLNLSLNKSEAKALSESSGETFTKNYSTNLSKTDTTNKSFTTGRNSSTSSTTTIDSSLIGKVGGAGIGFFLGGPAGALIVAGLGSMLTSGVSSSNGKTVGESSSETNGISNSNTVGETYGESKSFQTNLSNTSTDTSGKTLQITQKNISLEGVTKKLEKHLERIEKAEGMGLWNVGTYFLSKEPQNSTIAANIYNGIIRGENSNLEKNGVYSFNKHVDNSDFLENIKDYLFNFTNPILKIKNSQYEIFSTLGSLVTNDELALKFNFPQKSIGGLDVIKVTPFGRNQLNFHMNKKIDIGNLYHLGKVYSSPISLDLEALTSHTFITGSTGSGKSNSIYCILEELYKNNIKFMVIEPAKGEYKNIFGGKQDVKVFGTNINHTELLQINPFSFNENIHILEHIDRLIEIFNACWPMYAAMPAILKEAIENAYKINGWDLKNSLNLFGEKIYPNFSTLKHSLEKVISDSAYSQESKGDYTGALVTRVNSLNNGLVGNIFTENEIDEQTLFDENVIIDISRIPSTETKALIMGIVFMKLHEYRMSSHNEENSALKHVTIIEEAHNLLKRTSSDQSTEGSNLLGKSVEMMTNAIAEMRTYGEGFIIADQAPGLLDQAVIRNTNTKICLRLPSSDDRNIVGKSMNLDEKQIEELAKLETGVAAIIQGDWKEACLVKFNYMDNKIPYNYSTPKNNKLFLKNILKVILEDKLTTAEKLNDDNERENIFKYLEENNISKTQLTNKNIDNFIFEIIDAENILSIINATESQNIEEWNQKLELILKTLLEVSENEKIFSLEISNSIIRENTLRNPNYLEFYNKWDEFIRKDYKLW